MTLHGDISVNYKLLWTWEAVRQERDRGEVNTYTVKLRNMRGEIVTVTAIRHVYDDGALVLARAVLTWAERAVRDGAR